MINPTLIKEYLDENLGKTDIEIVNSWIEKELNAVNFDQNYVRTITSALPEFKKPKISILEVSAKSATFVKKLVHKYQDQCHFLDITMMFDTEYELDICKQIVQRYIPSTEMLSIKFVVDNFLDHELTKRYDLIIGTPKNLKIKGERKKALNLKFDDHSANNEIAFVIQKALSASTNTALLLPKYFMHNNEYSTTRSRVSKYEINHIIDFGELAFNGNYSENICLIVNTKNLPGTTRVISFNKKLKISQNQSEITNPSFPNWIVYINDFFKKFAENMQFGIFDAYRDRNISAKILQRHSDIKVLTAKNIPVGSKIVIDTEHDKFVLAEQVAKTPAYKYLNHPCAYICPNLTQSPRLLKKPLNTIASGSLAVFTPKQDITLIEADIELFSTEDFKTFYQIARNYSTRCLNIDKAAAFYFGRLKN